MWRLYEYVLSESEVLLFFCVFVPSHLIYFVFPCPVTSDVNLPASKFSSNACPPPLVRLVMVLCMVPEKNKLLYLFFCWTN